MLGKANSDAKKRLKHPPVLVGKPETMEKVSTLFFLWNMQAKEIASKETTSKDEILGVSVKKKADIYIPCTSMMLHFMSIPADPLRLN